MAGNPYWSLLAASLRETGLMVSDGKNESLRLKWLWANRGKDIVLHLHYIQQFYAFEVYHAKPRWVLRFARNLIIARLLGYLTVFTLHNLTPTYPLYPAWADNLGHWIAVNLTARVIVHCQAAKHLLTERYGRRRNISVTHHPNFIDLYPNSITKAAARVKLNIDPDHLVFLFFGGIRPNKGIENLIAAFQRIKGENIQLIIAGQPNEHLDYYHQILELSKSEARIQIHGRIIPEDEIQIYMNASDLVVLPFRNILTSSSVMLAMSFARPVVTPAMGCIPEYVPPSAGVLYDPGDPEGLYKVLIHCMSLDLYEMGQAAFEQAGKFTWENMANQTLTAYGIRV